VTVSTGTLEVVLTVAVAFTVVPTDAGLGVTVRKVVVATRGAAGGAAVLPLPQPSRVRSNVTRIEVQPNRRVFMESQRCIY
jgi:hypothetical protein